VFFLKILLVNDYEEKIGGCETYLYSLRNKLNDKNHQCEIIAGTDNSNNIKKYMKSLCNFKFRKSFKKKTKSFKPNVIYARSFNGNISPIFMPVAERKDIPIVVNAPRYEPFTLDGCKSPHQYLKRVYQKFFVKTYVDAWIAQSDFMYNFLNQKFPEKRISRIYHPRFWEPPKELSSDKFSNKLNIVYVGRLERSKGVHILLEVARILRDRTKNFRISIVGTGNEKDSLAKQIRENNLNDLFELMGYINHDNIKNIYKNANVMVHPCTTFKETFGLSIVEALSQGLPVITTKIGAQQEHIKNGYNGFLVAPGNATQIADRLEKLIHNKDLLEKMSYNAIKSSEKYDFDLHVKKLLEVFEEIIN